MISSIGLKCIFAAVSNTSPWNNTWYSFSSWVPPISLALRFFLEIWCCRYFTPVNIALLENFVCIWGGWCWSEQCGECILFLGTCFARWNGYHCSSIFKCRCVSALVVFACSGSPYLAAGEHFCSPRDVFSLRCLFDSFLFF